MSSTILTLLALPVLFAPLIVHYLVARKFIDPWVARIEAEHGENPPPKCVAMLVLVMAAWVGGGFWFTWYWYEHVL